MIIVLAAVALEPVDVGSDDLMDVAKVAGEEVCALALWMVKAAKRPSEYEESIMKFLLASSSVMVYKFLWSTPRLCGRRTGARRKRDRASDKRERQELALMRCAELI